MKNAILVFAVTLLLCSCGYNPQVTTRGYIVPNLSKEGQVAISDGQEVYLFPKDSVISDSLKLGIFFTSREVLVNPESRTKPDTSWHYGVFKVYKREISLGFRGSRDIYSFLVTDGVQSIKLELYSDGLTMWQRVLVIYRGPVTYRTYQVIN
jgi:hypothetical protein